MKASNFKNTLLSHLNEEEIARLQLRPVKLPVMHVLECLGESIDHVYFLEEGIASMTTLFENGAQVETSMFGYESAIGISALMGVKHSFNGIFMQLEGHGYLSPLRAANAEFLRQGSFQRICLRLVQTQLTLAIQNAACNAMHDHEQRLARWLLICCDRARQSHIEMSQDFVAQMLGSTRPTVSIAASSLKAAGLLQYSRGVIRVLDAKGLEARACECYRVVREHLETLSEFDPGFTV